MTHGDHNPVNKVTANAAKWFKFFDKDSDNSISPEELKTGLSQLNLFLDDQELSFLLQVSPAARSVGCVGNWPCIS